MAIIGAKISGRLRQIVYERKPAPDGRPAYSTELGRFVIEPMATNLTGECARGFGAAMRHKGPDSVSEDISSGRIDRQLDIRHPPSPWMTQRRKARRRIEG